MDLSDRMKEYERVTKSQLMKKTPMIIRIDGKAFHTWTKGLDRPFDKRFYAAMAKTAQSLANSIQGATFVYGQSDEISIFVRDYTNMGSHMWFDGSIQKIASVSASMATAYFNKYAAELGIDKKVPAFFDARVFNLPLHEVCNYFIWRQKDFHRNSIQMCARQYLGHKGSQGLKSQDMVDAMRQLEEPFDWYKDVDPIFRRGYSYVAKQDAVCLNVPDFVECREFIEVHVIN